MAGEWRTVSLREAGVTLIDCDHRTPPAAASGYPYVAIPQLKEGRLALSDARRISHKHFIEWTRKAKPQHHDVILSRRCNPGETAYVPEGIECALGQNLVLLRAEGKRLHPPFLRWLVRSPDWWAQIGMFINVGAVFESLRCADIPNFRLPVPPLPEQRAIASVLGSLDDLIELNRETNEILEEMARALFKSWFVDFDPVRAKLEGRPPAGMDAATAALFPDHFQDSELGQIPKGWEVVTLGSVLDTLETGRRPKGGVAGYSSGIPSVGAESINGIGVFDFSKTKFIPHEFYEKTISGRVQNLDVLLYKDGGKPGEFRPRVGLYGYGFPFDEFCINEHVFRMRADAVGQHYLYFAIADERVLLDFANKGGKAAIPGINQTDVRSTVIVLPPKSILDEFERQAQPICQSIIENFAESRDLAALRDALLPKLLSGEVSVAKAGLSPKTD
jgi:type I restriction enzyme S subunit